MGYVDYKAELLMTLRERSYKKGTFTLASGKESAFFIDCKATTLTSYGLSLTARVLLHSIQYGLGVPTALAAVPLGGCPLVDCTVLLAHQWGIALNILYVRSEQKDHGTQQKVEGLQNLGQSPRVVLIEDVVTTGNSSLRAVEVLREHDIEPMYVLALVDRLEGARVHLASGGVELISVYTKEDFLKL